MMVKCPYCNADIDENHEKEYYKSAYDCRAYWDEYRSICPVCEHEFRWFENYKQTDDDTMKIEDPLDG